MIPFVDEQKYLLQIAHEGGGDNHPHRSRDTMIEWLHERGYSWSHIKEDCQNTKRVCPACVGNAPKPVLEPHKI